MTAVTIRRALLFGTLAAVVYYALLDAITPQLPFATIPGAWRHLWPSALSGMLSWFGLLDLLAAVLSALPVVACLLWAMGRGGLKVGAVAGLLVGVCLICEALFLYPTSAHVLAAMGISLFAHSVAIPVVFLLAMSCPLTTRSSGR